MRKMSILLLISVSSLSLSWSTASAAPPPLPYPWCDAPSYIKVPKCAYFSCTRFGQCLDYAHATPIERRYHRGQVIWGCARYICTGKVLNPPKPLVPTAPVNPR